MTNLPSGTVTFLFTDIEGSTRLLKQLRGAYGELLDDHRRLLREAFANAGGHEIDTQGDAFLVAFSRVKDAVSAAVEGQRALAAHAWPQDVEVKVRMGIHTGEPTVGSERYFGLGLHRGARICGAAHGGQVLLSDASRAVAEDDLPDGIGLRELGAYELKDFDRPERLFQLVAQGLASDFPPPRTGSVSTAFEGRENELAEAAQAAVARPRLRRRVPLLAALAGLLAAAGILILVLTQSNGGGGVLVGPSSVAVIDPDTNDVVGAIEVGTSPSNVVVGEGAVWVLNGEDRTLSRIDPRAMDARAVGTGTSPTGLAVGAGSVWLVSGCPDIAVFRLDPRSNHVELLTKLPSDCVADRPSPSSIAYGAGSLWVTNIDVDDVWQIDAASAKLEATIPLPTGLSGPSAGEGIAVGEGAVWVNRKDAVVRVDPATRSTSVIEVRHEFGWIATGEGAVWTTDNFLQPDQGILWRVDPARGSAVRSIQVGSGALGVDVGAGSVWVANSTAGTVTRVDPLENAVESTIELGGIPRGVAVGEGAVWVTVG